MVTGYEVGMYNDIHRIARSLDRIADALEYFREADQKLAQEFKVEQEDSKSEENSSEDV